MSAGKVFVCGLDEAGRGPLAGPVSAGAVILPDDFPLELLDDSKKLSPKTCHGRKNDQGKSLLGRSFCGS